MSYDAVPLIPRSVLFGNPTYAGAQISPDGTQLGFLAPDDGVLNVWVGPLADPGAARPLTQDRGRGIRLFGFCHDDQTLYYLQDHDGDENWRLHLLDLATGEARCVTPFPETTVQVLEHNRWHPRTMLLGLNRDNPQLHDVYRLDLTDDSLTKVLTNPGYTGWLVDTDLVVRGASTMTETGGTVHHLRQPDSDEFTPWLAVEAEDTLTTYPFGFSRTGDTLYLISSVGANAGRLVEVDLATGDESVVAEDSAYDLGGVTLDPDTGRPQAVEFERDRKEWTFLDPEFARDFERMRGHLDADGDISVGQQERSGRLWTVVLMPADGPVRFYHYHRDTDTLTFLFNHKPELADYQLAPMEPFVFTARDGLSVHGYVTYPPGVARAELPTVLNVHGGPWHRDGWGYDPEAQWLANRGYACVQVNFRGSTGYGKAFTNAGNKQWGKAMHTDLLDAVAHLVTAGITDPDRVGIMGGSYGGYAALVGAAFTPEVFRCAVDMCGPANLLTLLASLPPYWEPIQRLFHTRMGDPETERDLLVAASPLTAADRIRIPVLVAQGANDVRVKQAEAEQIVAALREKGLPHEYLLFPDEGHGLVRPENRERYYAAVESFLATHLGGRTESAPTPG